MTSSLFSGAICILLIIITGYVIYSGILLLTEASSMAQKDADLKREQIDKSNISITGFNSGLNWVFLNILNNGNSVYSINEIRNMDLFLNDDTSGVSRYTNETTPHFSYFFKDDIVNQNMWDPGETLNITINLTSDITPNCGRFITSDGAVANSSLCK